MKRISECIKEMQTNEKRMIRDGVGLSVAVKESVDILIDILMVVKRLENPVHLSVANLETLTNHVMEFLEVQYRITHYIIEKRKLGEDYRVINFEDFQYTGYVVTPPPTDYSKHVEKMLKYVVDNTSTPQHFINYHMFMLDMLNHYHKISSTGAISVDYDMIINRMCDMFAEMEVSK